LGQPKWRGSEPDEGWQCQHGCLEIGIGEGSEDLFQGRRETLKRQASAADQLMKPVDRRDPGIFINRVQI
jgi:hypothetical protein